MFGAKKWFTGGDAANVEVRDADTAKRWYAEKLGLSYCVEENEPEWTGFSLGYSADEIQICLVRTPGAEKSPAPRRPPIMFTKKLSGAHEYFS